jgi:hypothetical protein
MLGAAFGDGYPLRPAYRPVGQWAAASASDP